MSEFTSDSRDRLIESILSYVPIEGWSDAALQLGGHQIGMAPAAVISCFPSGVRDAVKYFSHWADRRMSDVMEDSDFLTERVSQRIIYSVEARLRILDPHKEATRRCLSWFTVPPNTVLGLRLLYHTVDNIWHGIGDHSADFSFYTKRGLLAAVLGSTILFWVEDSSTDCEETSAFLERRIDDVMQIHSVRQRVNKLHENAVRPVRVLRAAVEKRYGRPFKGDIRVT